MECRGDRTGLANKESIMWHGVVDVYIESGFGIEFVLKSQVYTNDEILKNHIFRNSCSRKK